jgi:hypothetical protein
MIRASAALPVLARAILWIAIALVLVRGTLDIARPARIEEGGSPQAVRESDRAFPDREALAFAVGFARAYLTFSPGRADDHARSLEAFLAPTLERHAGLVLPATGRGQSVAQATVARVQRLDARRALVTVAAELTRASGIRYLTVPVARDEGGALAVFDYPSFAAAPRRSLATEEEERGPLGRYERPAIEALLRRFFPAYHAGPADALAYFASPRVRLGAVAGPYAHVELLDVAELARPAPRRVLVAADVRARDATTGALYLLRYRVLLERDERWYVVAINADSKGAS